MKDNPTPETDAETMQDEYDHIDSDVGPFTPSETVPADFARKLERERNVALEQWELCIGLSKKNERERDEARSELVSEKYWLIKERDDALSQICQAECRAERFCQERDEAREEVKELIYISERAIALAEIDYENDKFGVVSELRDQLEKIKNKTK